MAVTIKTVAQAAEVSTATVSHVFNGTRFVAAETKKKVIDTANRLGYVPNVSASGLRSNRTKRIGLLVPAISSFFTVDILDAIENVLLKNGYQLVIGCSHENLEREKEQVSVFNYQQIDGMIMFPAPGDHSYLDQMPRKYPIVFIDRAAANCQRDLIIGDNEKAAYEITGLLLQEGRRVGLITGTEHVSALDERVDGYRQALADHGIPYDPALVQNGASNAEGAYRATEALLQAGGVTAILSLAPPMSVGCLQCLMKRRISVPQEMALVGFGDSAWAEVTSPPLTVLRHPMYEMGRRAAERLLERLDEASVRDSGGAPAPYQTIRMPIEIIRRQSF